MTSVRSPSVRERKRALDLPGTGRSLSRSWRPARSASASVARVHPPYIRTIMAEPREVRAGMTDPPYGGSTALLIGDRSSSREGEGDDASPARIKRGAGVALLHHSMSLPRMTEGARPPESGRSLRALGVTQRSTRFHRPRAPFCGIGYCTNCIVRTPGRIHDRDCLSGFRTPDALPLSRGWPSVRFDLGGLLDLVFPRGIDILHGLRRPAWAIPLYQKVVRRLSGYGRPSRGGPLSPAPLPPPTLTEVDVTVVGGGVGGIATAEELRSQGVESVLVLDRGARTDATDPDPGLVSGMTAIFLPPPEKEAARPFTVLASREEDGRAQVVRSRRVVVATGGYDASLLFAGNDRPGVMTADGAFAFASAGHRPFQHAVVFGSGPRALSVLERFEGAVSALVAPGDIGPEVTRVAADRGVALYPRSLLVEARGRRWVRSVLLRTRGKGAPLTLRADAVVLAHRRIPHPQLFFQAGARMRWSADTGAYYPETDASGATSVAGLYAVGEARGPVSVEGTTDHARAAARAIALAEPPAAAPMEDAPAATAHPLEGYYRELLPEMEDGWSKWVACPCEDVLLHEVVQAHRLGYRGIEVIKRYTGLGTGLCQGRYCLPDALLLLSILEGRPPSAVGFITQRPPVVPTRLDTLASLAGLLGPHAEGKGEDR